MADPNDRYEMILNKLRDGNQKLTHQRMAVARILAESEGHPSVEMIYERLKTEYPTISLATVYRNVMLIKSLGEVIELGFPDGSNRYDGNKPYPHPHVICVRCKSIMDPDLDMVTDMTREVELETGFEIVNHRLDFFGVCPACKKKSGRSG